MTDLDQLLATLKRRKSLLESELTRLEKNVQLVEELKKELNRAPLAFQAEETPEKNLEVKRVRGTLPPQKIAMEARSVILKNGRPMRRGAIAEELLKNGVPLAGKDRNKSLGTILWRHPEMFVTIKNLGYWAKGVSLMGVYDPEET